ncbi:Mu transposase domain-containing protein [Bradyrhizobium sp. USDA 4506]
MCDAEIFVAVLGASNYTYVEATWTQTLPDWIEAHARMSVLWRVPRLVVPDNLKSGVHRASFYDPEIKRSYGMMASHYGVGVLPARPRNPRDKAKVEARVRFAQTYILGRLRRQTFFSLVEANAAIVAALERINAYVMRRLDGSRRRLFETVEMPVLAPLPDADYQFAEWRVAHVSLDYHVEIDGFFYSVPHEQIRERVDVRATTRTLELLHRGSRVAAHHRRYGGRQHGTDPDHMPSAHRRYTEWTPRAVPSQGTIDRTKHRGSHPRHPGQSASSRTGISGPAWRASAVQGVVREELTLRPAQAVFRAGTVSKKARMMTRKNSASHRSSRPKL